MRAVAAEPRVRDWTPSRHGIHGTVAVFDVPRQLTAMTGPSPAKKGSARVAYPCLSPDVLEPPTACARSGAQADIPAQSATSARCSTRAVARALPLNTLEANPTGRVALLSPPVHWDRSPWSSPGFFSQSPQNRLQIAPGSRDKTRLNQAHRHPRSRRRSVLRHRYSAFYTDIVISCIFSVRVASNTSAEIPTTRQVVRDEPLHLASRKEFRSCRASPTLASHRTR